MAAELLKEKNLYEVLSRTFPKQNDFLEEHYAEELAELNHFGINTVEELEALLAKHFSKAMELDAEEHEEEELGWYMDEYGKAYVQERLDGKFWFAYQGLLRIVLELEFGDDYISFADEQDDLRGNQ